MEDPSIANRLHAASTLIGVVHGVPIQQWEGRLVALMQEAGEAIAIIGGYERASEEAFRLADYLAAKVLP